MVKSGKQVDEYNQESILLPGENQKEKEKWNMIKLIHYGRS